MLYSFSACSRVYPLFRISPSTTVLYSFLFVNFCNGPTAKLVLETMYDDREEGPVLSVKAEEKRGTIATTNNSNRFLFVIFSFLFGCFCGFYSRCDDDFLFLTHCTRCMDDNDTPVRLCQISRDSRGKQGSEGCVSKNRSRAKYPRWSLLRVRTKLQLQSQMSRLVVLLYCIRGNPPRGMPSAPLSVLAAEICFT